MDGVTNDRPRRWLRTGWPLLALYALSLALHLPFLSTPIYGDEAVQYTVARDWGEHSSRATELYTGQRVDYTLVFWQRPAFPMLLSPGALVGFTGMRLEFVLLTSLLAPLAFAALRASAVRTSWAAVAGIAVAADPLLNLWGTRLFPDALCAVFLLAGVLQTLRGRHVAAASFLVVAAWVKELALPAILGITLLRFVRARAGRRPGALRASVAPYALASVVAPVPLLYCTLAGARLPGWSTGGDLAPYLPRLFVGLWAIPLLLLLAARRPASPLPWIALGYPLFFVLDHLLRDVALQEWYLFVPHVFVLLGVGHALDIVHSLVAATVRLRPDVRVQAVPAAVVVPLLLLSPAIGFSGYGAALEYARSEGQDLMQVKDLLERQRPGEVLLIDVGWYDIEFPLGESAALAHYVYTTETQDSGFSAQPIHDAARRPGALTVLHRPAVRNELSHALDEAYAACRLLDRPTFAVVRGADCAA